MLPAQEAVLLENPGPTFSDMICGLQRICCAGSSTICWSRRKPNIGREKDLPMSMQVYGFWRSIASFRVRVALRLKGLPFEEIPIDILSGEQFEPGYEAVNAERVVPTFIHDGHSVFQSLAIIEYLDDIQPKPRLIPEDAKERAYA